MKKNDIKKLHDETAVSLLKKAQTLKSELATLRVNARNNPPKDTNTVSKKKKELAILLTVAHLKATTN